MNLNRRFSPVVMTSRGFRKNMTDVILTSADISALAREHASHSRVCAALEGLSRQLLELTTVIQTIRVDNPSNELDNLTSELSWQLENAKQLAQGLATYPEVYRAMSAARIRAQCLHVCRSIGDSLENLTIMLVNLGAKSEFPEGYFEKLRELAFAFRHLEYPLQTQDIMIRQKTKDWSTQVYNGTMKQIDGLISIRDYLEDVIGKEKLKDDWGKVSTFFLHDIYNAHSRDDPEEEHYLRLLFWALNGVMSPPPEYLCPISLSIMQDPVVLCESEVTYERQNITTWMIEDETKTCPVSQKQIRSVHLIENASLKTAIANWQREQSRNPDFDFNSTYPDSDDMGSLRSQTELMTTGAIDTWDGRSSTVTGIEDQNPLYAVPLSSVNLAGRGQSYPTTPHQRASVDAMSVTSGSTSRIQRHIMTKEISSQMFAAAAAGAVDVLMEIREKDWDLSMLDGAGRNPLHLACIHGRHNVVQYLLEQGLSPNVPTKDDLSSPLILAASNGHSKCVEILLERGADLVGQDKRGWTALHSACDLGHRNVIESLVKFGELRHIRYLDMKTESGWTVLHNAARKGDLEVFKFLLRFRCNINEPCKSGWTVLHIAVERGHQAIVEEILRRPSSNINARSRDGWTAMHSAVDSGDVVIGRLLIRKHINVNAASNNGYTALHRAAYYNKLEFGRLLVEDGKADLSLKTQNGRTAKDITSDRGFNDFHKYLFRRGMHSFFKPKKK